MENVGDDVPANFGGVLKLDGNDTKLLDCASESELGLEAIAGR